MKRREILGYFDYDSGSGDYDSKNGNYTITHIGRNWYLMGVVDTGEYNEYTDLGKYVTLSDAMDFYINSVIPNESIGGNV